MWLKNGMKRFFEIFMITLFLFFLLGNLPYARAQEQEWHWGLENCTIGDCPEGLAGIWGRGKNSWPRGTPLAAAVHAYLIFIGSVWDKSQKGDFVNFCFF